MKIFYPLNAVIFLLLLTSNANAQLNDGDKVANQHVQPKVDHLSREETLALDGHIDLHNESLRSYFDHVKKNNKASAYYLELLSHFSKFDFEDGTEGLIYSSFFDTEEMHNLIWIKQGNHYKYSGELTGERVKIYKQP